MGCPKALCFSSDEMNLYIIDSDHKTSKILRCNLHAILSHNFVIEAGDIAGYEDGVDTAKFNKPSAVTIDTSTKKLLISDTKNAAIRALANQCVSTVFKSSTPELFQPVGIAYSHQGILVSDPTSNVIYIIVPNINIKVEYRLPLPSPELSIKADITIPLSTVEDIKSIIARVLQKDPMLIRIDIVARDNESEKLSSVSMIQHNSFLRVIDLPKNK